LAAAAAAQESRPPGDSSSPPVAATVNGKSVFVAEVMAMYGAMAGRKQINPASADRAKAEILRQLVHRQLVAQALERDGTLVTPKEMDDKMQTVRAQARKQSGLSLEDFARKQGVSIDKYHHDAFWRMAWERYLDRHLADALETHFNKHKKDLDGTQVRASHILLRPEKYNESTAHLEARAKKIREEIESGKITFEEAAQKYSAGPSRRQGGDLGYFARYGAMLQDFSKAAFELETGQISQPVSTLFGTHLIRVTEIKPGSRQWTEVIPQIKSLASSDLFKEIADKELPAAKIEYTGTVPYFKPGTGELVVPKPPDQAASK
jgi:peptidyl-prolyl cis-trans isomerase C